VQNVCSLKRLVFWDVTTCRLVHIGRSASVLVEISASSYGILGEKKRKGINILFEDNTNLQDVVKDNETFFLTAVKTSNFSPLTGCITADYQLTFSFSIYDPFLILYQIDPTVKILQYTHFHVQRVHLRLNRYVCAQFQFHIMTN